MKLRKVLALSLAAAMTLSMVGCGGKETTEAPAATETETEATDTEAPAEDTADAEAEAEAPAEGVPYYTDITLGEDYTDLTATIKWIHHKTDRRDDGTLDAMIAEFNKVYPNITVESEAVTDYGEDALLRLSTGDWGDIMMIPAVDKADFPTYYQPLDTYEKLDAELNFVIDKEKEGLCYGIPYMGNAQGVLYNKAVFEAAGVAELPATPTAFLEALQMIKDNTDAIPMYTNYAAGWTMGAWDAYVGVVTHGDENFLNQKFVHTADPFADPGDDTGIYNLYRILYDAVANDLIEDDYMTTDWEGCKGMLNRGEIGTMVLGSWAFAQMAEAGDTPENVGYMPFPMTVGGTKYVMAGGDYNYGVNVNSSDDNKTASIIFIKWMTEESGWGFMEGGYPVDKDGELPEMYAAFDGCTVLSNGASLPGEDDLLNQLNAESELSFNAGGDAKVQRIVDAAATGSKTYDEIMSDWTTAWNDGQDYLEIEVNQ